MRGLVMHKLFEEVLNGETADTAAALEARASDLLRHLGQEPSLDATTGFSAAEISGAIVRALALPEIPDLRPTLTPELPVYAFETREDGDVATAGVADAVSYDASGRARVVVDWKSDVDPVPDILSHYQDQVRAYLRATGAEKGLIVLATKGVAIGVSAK